MCVASYEYYQREIRCDGSEQHVNGGRGETQGEAILSSLTQRLVDQAEVLASKVAEPEIDRQQ